MRNEQTMFEAFEKFINKHWIIFNPIFMLIYAHIFAAIIFALLGWEE